jgi:hypothetical protein
MKINIKASVKNSKNLQILAIFLFTILEQFIPTFLNFVILKRFVLRKILWSSQRMTPAYLLSFIFYLSTIIFYINASLINFGLFEYLSHSSSEITHL